jgi:hypothetical protein
MEETEKEAKNKAQTMGSRLLNNRIPYLRGGHYFLKPAFGSSH